MYRSSSGRSGPSSSSSSHRLKEGSSSGSRASRSSTSGPGPGRGRPPPPPPPPAAAAASSSSSSAAASASPPRSASPRPPPRRHRSPSGHRGASRRSPSPHRSRRLPSPPGGPGPGGTRGRRGSEHGDGSSSRRRSPSLRSESSLEQSLRITVGNDRYCIGTPERRRLPDRLGSPIDNLSDRDDMADGPIFTRGLSCPRGLERYPSHEDQSSSPFIIRHDEDYRNRDVFLHRSDYSPHYGRREELPRGSDRDGDKLRKSSYPSRPEERGREIKRPRYEKDEKMHGVSGEHQSFSSGTRNYRRRSRSRSRSPSPSYLNEEFRELDRARRKREEEERSRNLNHDVSGSGYVIPGLTNTLQTSEPRYTYRPEEIPSMPKKSILKKRVEVEVESPIQPEGFSSSLAPSKDLPLLSSHSALPQSNDTAPFASEVENFLKRFSKDSVVESANKELHDGLYEWSSLSGAPKDAFTFEEKFGSFLSHKEKVEPKSEPADRHTDFLLPHERASQDGSGFSRILGMMADSVSAQEKRRRSFPDIEDEEKFLYGDEDEDTKTESLPVQKPPASCGNDIIGQKMSPPPSPASAVKLDPLEDSNAEYAKIHDLLKTIGLDIGVAEIGKLAVRTQERLHGKKLASRSPDRRSSDPRRLDPWDLRRSRSDTRSPESGQQRSASPPVSFQQSKDASALQKSEYIKNKPIGQDIPPCAPEQPLPSVSLIPSVPPAPASLPPTPSSVSQYQIPNYSQFTATQMPQNYPPPTMAPPGYDAYGHYMAYAAPGWTMYPPAQQPNPTLPEAHGLLTMAMSANPTRPNLRVIETVSMGKDVPDLKRDGSVLVHVPTTPAHSKVPLRLSSHPLKNTTEKMSDEKNRAAQKQKVIEEREKLKNEREARQKKLYYLKTELDRLRKQQGEMLRKKRREKDGHKDPLLVEVNRLQENIMKEISELHKESDAADKKQSELDKVAQILGINIFEKPRKPSVETKDSSEKNSKSENAKGLEKTSSNKESKATNEKSRGRSPKPAESSSQSSKHPFQLANIYEYYDAGNHWCKDCNTICGTMFDFFTHMHNKKHRQTLDPYNRPWASKTQSETKQDSIKRIDKITVPAKGSEFLIPITGYYCQLCHEFFGDQISAEQHVKSHPHNEKYKKYIDENPLYEERRNLDRQAGLAVVLETERRRQSELKRKLVEKQKEEKDEKKPKIIKKEEAKSIPELGEGTSETQGKIDSAGRKMGIKLKLKKEEKEEKKEEKKEETKKESPSQTSFGKFSWKKTEREDKTPGGAIPKEESTEGNKEENKCQPGKPHVKPIEIKLSGKTVIPHTSPWTPVVSTSTPAKILPNLPVPTMIFRKSTTATVSKPAPLNTFLSIKSSGATTKPLPVVKETNADLLLPPDIISKAFGGEEVILKGAEEELKATEKSESSQTSDIPPPPPPPPAVQPAAVIPADEVAPGVSESEQTMLAMPVRPPPPPRPSTAFSEQAKKVEKRNSCLATANAKDLYDIFYSSGGKGSADSKLASSALANGENSNLTKPADLSPNPRTNNSSSSLKEDSQNMATDVSQVHSAERSLELEKTDIQETSVLHTDISPDIENGIRKDVGQKFQAPLSTDVRTKLKEDSSQCNNQVMGSWVLGENQAAMNKKPLQPQLPEMSVTELPETKTASGIQMPAEIGLVDIGGREQVGSQEFCNLQKAEIQEKVGQEDANKTAVTNKNVPGTLEKDAEMKDWKVKTVNPELSLHPKTLLPETQNEIQNLGNSHLVEGKLSDNCRTHSEADSPNLVCESQNTSKGKALVAVMTEQSSIDASLKDVKLKSVALEISQPGVLGKAPRTLETQNKISELTRSPGEWATSRTSNGEEQVITARSCSERGWDLSGTPNVEIKAGSNEVSSSELVEIQPDACLANTQTRSSTLEAQEKVRPEPSGHTVLDNQTQRQEVAWLVNACSANIVEVRSSVELVVEVGKKSLGHTGSDATLDNVFVKRDAKEVGTGGFSRARSDIFQESVVALSANFCREHLSEEAVHPPETKHEVVRTSAANDFHLNTVHSGLNSEQSKNFSANVRVDNKKVSLTSEDAKHNEIPSQKAELEFKSTDFSLGDTKVKHECFSILTAGLLNENTEEVSKLETVASIRLESSKLRKLSIEKTVDEREITDFAALTSSSQEDKFCTRISQTAVPQLGLQSSNSDTTEVVMPVLEMQDISPVSEILLQVEESKGGAVEMPSLSCDGGSTESQASGCVETFRPGPKEASGKEGGSGGKGVCIIQSKKTEQTETADSSLEATTNSGIAESLAESPVG